MGPVRRDTVIVGGGLLGLTVAARLAEEGRLVDVFVSPEPDPRSDSQRNHSWLQSGLLYPGTIIARSMYYDGLAMLDHFGVPAPAKRGLFRFSTLAEADAFLAHAKEIRLESKIEEVSYGEAQSRLGIFYRPNCFHFSVPDAPFPEALVMELARSRATLLGARFRESRVKIERDSSSENGYVLVTEEERILPELAIVCAGAGTPKLLQSLDIPHPLVVNQSVLLVITDAVGIRTPLLADRTSGLTVVVWDAQEIPPRGRIVVGASDRRVLAAAEEDTVRKVLDEERNSLVNLLPPALRLTEENHRFTAGQKTDVFADGKVRVSPWVHVCPDLPGLIFATPGKATLSFWVAQRILDLVAEQGNNRSSCNPPEPSEPPPGASFEVPIRSHHEPEFDGLDERGER